KNDDEGKPFDCSNWYVEGQNYRRIKPNFFETSNAKDFNLPYESFAKLDRPLNVAIISGVQRQNYRKFDPTWFKPAIEGALIAKNQEEHRKLLPEITRPGEEDLSVNKLLVLLWRVGLNLQINSKDILIEPDFVQVKLSGKLKHSQKDINLTVVLGNMSTDHEAYARFAGATGELFVVSDIFMYEGHSGFGRSLSPENIGIAEAAAKIPKEKIPQHQLLAFFSCQSLFHYHPQKFGALPRIEDRIWVQTLGDYTDVNGNGSLGVLASLESYIKTGRAVPFDRWAK